MRVTAIIAAGGAGRRIGAASRNSCSSSAAGRFWRAASARSIRTRRSLTSWSSCPPSLHRADAQTHIGATVRPLTIVAGGPRRQDSVANAFASVDPSAEIVLIHDAARPFVSAELIERTIDAAAAHGAAIAALEARDTVKRVERHPYGALIVETIPRDTVFLAQTPQGFRREVLAAAVALGRSGVDATDEASLAERAGHPVHVVEGDPGNVKITTADDLEARGAVRRRRGRSARVGTGYDLHRLVEGRPLRHRRRARFRPTRARRRTRTPTSSATPRPTPCSARRASATSAGTFPIPIREWKGASSLDLLRDALRALVATQRLRGRQRRRHRDPRAAEDRGRTSSAMRARLAGALGVDRGARQRQGQDQRGRRRRRPRRSDCGARGRAAEPMTASSRRRGSSHGATA